MKFVLLFVVVLAFVLIVRLLWQSYTLLRETQQKKNPTPQNCSRDKFD